MTDQIARAWAYLSRVAEPPCPELRGLARRVGPVEAAERVRTGNVDGPIAQRTEARCQIDRAAEDLDVLTRLGGRLVTADDDEWPLLAFRSFGGVADRLNGYVVLLQGHAAHRGRRQSGPTHPDIA